MIDKIIRADKEYNLFDGVKEITVAISGGADSVALLYALNNLKNDFGFKIYAAHYHHGIRGAEADRDLEWTKNFCESLGVPFVFEKGDAPKYAEEKGVSIETAARELRYDFLNRVKKGVIATAHTASDNIETMIFNISRGTSLNGLKGIPAKRDGIIRPIILCNREDIENYCKDNNLEFMTDSTNLIDDCSRNIIRHKVVPVLTEINENAVINASKLAVTLNEDNDYLSFVAENEYKKRLSDGFLDLCGFEMLHKSIAKRVIIKFYRHKFATVPDSLHIEEMYGICLAKSGKVSIIEDFVATVKGNSFCFEKTVTEDAEFSVETAVLSIEEYHNLKKVHGLFSNYAVDCDKIIGNIRKLPKNNADKIKLSNSSVTKTLKKLLTEKKVPKNLRNNLPVFADDGGIVLAHKIGVADRVKIDNSTKKVLFFKIYEV
ncbi:MAG: tRNA lysidine(34) synthetase TilS [Clostridia bacterium]|nr:tRNA lysidine(34) synthetase TilS [Clostridia bacterium]